MFAVNHSYTVMPHDSVLCIFLRYSWLVCSVRSQSQNTVMWLLVFCVSSSRYSWLVCSVRSQSQLHCHVVVSVLCIFLRYQLVSLQCSQSITVTLSCGCCVLCIFLTTVGSLQCSPITEHCHSVTVIDCEH